MRRFARGEMVYGGGTECAGLILPTEGQLRAYMLTDEGRELTLYRLFPRDMCLFSASCVLRGIQFDVLVEAERDTTALFLPAEVYQGLMEESAAVANYTSELMADRFSEVMWRMDQILSKKLDGRLAALLVEESRLAESASLRLTHDQLARHLGSAREVVSRLLKDFQNDGLVRLGRAGWSCWISRRWRLWHRTAYGDFVTEGAGCFWYPEYRQSVQDGPPVREKKEC